MPTVGQKLRNTTNPIDFGNVLHKVLDNEPANTRRDIMLSHCDETFHHYEDHSDKFYFQTYSDLGMVIVHMNADGTWALIC